MDERINLAEKLGLLEAPYRPGIVGYLNDYKLVVVKVHASSSGTSMTTPMTSSSSFAGT